MQRKLGKLPARKDMRIPRLSRVSQELPTPPVQYNGYAAVPDWRMLANDVVGNCTVAAILHQIMQLSAYANPGHGLIPTDTEAMNFYRHATGYTPDDPRTDQGAYMLGRGGIIETWAQSGIVCGGDLNKPSAFVQITRPNPIQWKQAISTFGSLLLGVQMPRKIAEADEVPFVWRDPSGPIAGGHEIIAVGYNGFTDLYDIISWGQHYRASESFLVTAVDEAITVYDRASLNARGKDASGIDEPTLLAAMDALRLVA